MVDPHPLASQVYDFLMADIEPELLLATIPTLEKKYESESPKEHEKRMQRYTVAYKKFDEAFKKFSVTVGGAVRDIKHDALKRKEQEATKEDQKAIDDLEAKF